MTDDSRVFEDIAFLRQVVEDSRRVVIDNGVHLLAWGVLVVIGMIFTYISEHFKLNLPILWNWIVLISLGWILTIWDGWIKMTRARTRTFVQKVLASLWFGLGIVMTLVGFIGPATGAISTWGTIPLFSLILGAGLFATGTVHQERLRGFAAVGWWIGGIFTMLFPGDYEILLFAGMMIAFQILPGVVLYRKWKREMGIAI